MKYRCAMLDSAQIRRRGAVDFEAYYSHACGLHDTLPIRAVKASVKHGVLDVCGDHISLADWTPLLNTLAVNTHLYHVAFRSFHQLAESDKYRVPCKRRNPALRSKDVTFRLCKAIQDCLCISASLKTLQLYNLPLRSRDLVILTKGLSKSSLLENLSLALCPISDEGLETVCQSVKYSHTIKWVDFTGCNLTWRGAEHMANIIKHQAMVRHNAAWAESLRYRKPELEGMNGLRRITLNSNMLVGDRGAAVLAQELCEDLWVKAVDLQNCGLSNEGAKALQNILQTNCTLNVIDIRKNPLVDNRLVKAIIERVVMNTNGTPSQYPWIKPVSCGDQPGNVSRRSNISSSSSSRVLSHTHRRFPQAAPKHFYQTASSVKVTITSESDSDEQESLRTSPVRSETQDTVALRHYKRLQVELEECKLALSEERKAKAMADTHVLELELENKRLRGINVSLVEALQSQTSTSAAMEDDTLLESIEASFQKFHAFLDLLKDAGLGQLVSMADIKQTDFGPRFTSTTRGNAKEMMGHATHGETVPSGSLLVSGGDVHSPHSNRSGSQTHSVYAEECSRRSDPSVITGGCGNWSKLAGTGGI